MAAALLILLLLSSPATAQSDTSILVVNEFFFRGASTDLEFVEIHNRSGNPIDLRSLELSDSRRRPVAFSPTPRILAAGGFAVAVRDAQAFDDRFDYPDRIEISGWPALNNSGDTIILWRNGSPIDSVAYASSWGGDDVSLERLDPSGPSSAAANWAESVDRSGGTPGQINSVFAPDNQPPQPIFCEEIAPGSLAVYFSEQVAPESATTGAFRFDSGFAPNEVFVGSSGDVVFLSIAASVDASLITIRGITDLSGNKLSYKEIGVAWLPRPRELALNEIMFEPLADEYDGLPDQPEYLEILSAGDRLISIRSLYLTDALREDGTRDTTFLGQRRLGFGPNGILLAHAQTDPDQDPLAAFPSIDRSSPDLTIIQIDRATLSLGNNGDLIRLEGSLGLIDEVEYTRLWHLPERVTTRGWSLERISVSVDAQNPANWSTSVDPSGGTPGRPNSVRHEPDGAAEKGELTVSPAPFSPDGDGFEDFLTIVVEIPSATAVLRVWIFDLDGLLVRELVRAQPVANSSSVIWDGRNDEGDPLQAGLYVVLVEAVDTSSGYVERMKTPVVLFR